MVPLQAFVPVEDGKSDQNYRRKLAAWLRAAPQVYPILLHPAKAQADLSIFVSIHLADFVESLQSNKHWTIFAKQVSNFPTLTCRGF